MSAGWRLPEAALCGHFQAVSPNGLSFRSAPLMPLFLSLFHFNIKFFIWLCQGFAVVRGIFSCSMQTFTCGMWDLAPWPGMEPALLAWGV